jgi:hypothetical protein
VSEENAKLRAELDSLRGKQPNAGVSSTNGQTGGETRGPETLDGMMARLKGKGLVR